MTAFITSLAFVVLAEMGDKTQLLAMTFATRYRWQTVMWGVFFATVLNHLFAVLVGNYMTNFVPMHYIQIVASISFIIFGWWTIKGDEISEDDAKARFGPFLTVAIAFFIAEMGDKTQLATIALGAKFNTLIPVWMGTTTGMLIADGLGILIGIVLGKKIPERLVKWLAAILFILFGLLGLYQAVPSQYISVSSVSIVAVVVIAMTYLIARWSDKENTDVESEPAK